MLNEGLFISVFCKLNVAFIHQFGLVFSKFGCLRFVSVEFFILRNVVTTW